MIGCNQFEGTAVNHKEESPPFLRHTLGIYEESHIICKGHQGMKSIKFDMEEDQKI